jgi:hypothetical protein
MRDNPLHNQLEGSSTVATMAALGLLLNIKRRRLTLFY